MITFTYQLTLRDCLRANRLATRRLRRVFGFVFLVAAAGFCAWGQYLLAGVFAFYALVGVPLLYRVLAGRRWRRTPAMHKGEQTWQLDEVGLHGRDDAGNPTVVHWDSFLSFRESRDAFLLYLNPAVFVVLPKRVVGPADEAEARMLLKERIGDRAAGVPQGAPVPARSSGGPSSGGGGGFPPVCPHCGKEIGTPGGDGRPSGD